MNSKFENIIGVAAVTDLGEKILEILKETEPKLSLITLTTTTAIVGLDFGFSKEEFTNLMSIAWDSCDRCKNKKNS